MVCVTAVMPLIPTSPGYKTLMLVPGCTAEILLTGFSYEGLGANRKHRGGTDGAGTGEREEILRLYERGRSGEEPENQ